MWFHSHHSETKIASDKHRDKIYHLALKQQLQQGLYLKEKAKAFSLECLQLDLGKRTMIVKSPHRPPTKHETGKNLENLLCEQKDCEKKAILQ